jgi:transposase-like protein/IS1 family transposase
MNCPNCNGLTKKHGKHRNGLQRFRCNPCKLTFTEEQDKPLSEMRLPIDKALLCLQLLVEGNSIRSTERITGVHRDTVLSLLKTVGEKCDKLMQDKFRNLKVQNIQADEIWAFVGMKDKTKKANGKDDIDLGSAYTFTAIESRSKLVFAWHLGKRSEHDALIFLEKIYTAIEGTKNRFQMSTDAFRGYDHTVNEVLGTRADYAQVIKIYGKPNPDEIRYSAAECIAIKKRVVCGNPDLDRTTTSHVERQNLTMRMSMRRLTRLTNGFSKKWENLRLSLALHFAHYNFCRVHKTIRCTPAMEAGITKTVWSIKDLIEYKPKEAE